MARSADTGLLIAEALRGRPGIERVLHPAFPECPGHDLWRRGFAGFNGVFSVVLAPAARPHLDAFVDALHLFRIGASWGGTHSLVTPQDPAASRTAVPWTSGRIVRFSVGLEAATDLIADVELALERLHDGHQPSPRSLGEAVP
jgi:cystathionine beta-lyase